MKKIFYKLPLIGYIYTSIAKKYDKLFLDKNPQKWLERKYLKLMGKKLNLDNPLEFNEKLQWLKLYNKKHIHSKLVDKYEVREHIKASIGEEYLIPIYGVYNSFDEINFDILPNKFVLKCTHDSGGVYICNNKNNFNQKKARKFFKKHLKKNFYYIGAEWPYKNIKPRIICEKFMEDEIEKDLKDFKILCFSGEPKIIQICSERFNGSSGVKMDFYDVNWSKIPVKRGEYLSSNKPVEKPKCLDEMIDLAKILSKGEPFLRVDFYYINNKIYFGELTFYPSSGFVEFKPGCYNRILGEWIKLV